MRRRAEDRAARDANYLADMDAGFYVVAYLRAWAFEAQLRAYPARGVRARLVHRREAGSLLRELWAEGQRMRPRTSCSARSRARRSSSEAVAERPRSRRPTASTSVLRLCISFMHEQDPVLIAGAAGRDFHNFNVVYRGRDDVRGRRVHRDADPEHRRARLPGRARGSAVPGRHPDPRRVGARATSSRSTRSTRSSSRTRT